MDFKDWQTLLAGVLATAAATVTVFQVGRQIRQSDEALRHERERRASSHRAMLPLVLSDIVDLIEIDNAKLRTAITNKSHPAALDWPSSVSAQFETLRSVIEFDDHNKEQAEKLRLLISQIQVYRARRRPKSVRTVASLEGLDRLRDAAEIYVSASRLFDYARGENFRQKSRKEEFFQAIRSLGYWDGIDDDVYRYFQIYYPDTKEAEIQTK